MLGVATANVRRVLQAVAGVTSVHDDGVGWLQVRQGRSLGRRGRSPFESAAAKSRRWRSSRRQ
jgi:hypothetical protein